MNSLPSQLYFSDLGSVVPYSTCLKEVEMIRILHVGDSFKKTTDLKELGDTKGIGRICGFSV